MNDAARDAHTACEAENLYTVLCRPGPFAQQKLQLGYLTSSSNIILLSAWLPVIAVDPPLLLISPIRPPLLKGELSCLVLRTMYSK